MDGSPTEPELIKKIATHITIPITQAKTRLLSDIDDTIKVAGILAGARTVLRNVFTKNPEELIIKGMADWYRSLHTRGVRFHYVSNSPFGLLPIINEFLTAARLPEGKLNVVGKSLVLISRKGQSSSSSIAENRSLLASGSPLESANALVSLRCWTISSNHNSSWSVIQGSKIWSSTSISRGSGRAKFWESSFEMSLLVSTSCQILSSKLKY